MTGEISYRVRGCPRAGTGSAAGCPRQPAARLGLQLPPCKMEGQADGGVGPKENSLWEKVGCPCGDDFGGHQPTSLFIAPLTPQSSLPPCSLGPLAGHA